MKTRLLLLLLPVLLLVAGCGSSQSLEYIPSNGTILAFGDSLTRGTGVSLSESYPSVLHELSGRTVINAGIPGELSKDGLSRLPGVLDQHQPDLLILIHGGNDMLRKKNLDTAADNLKQMINLARARGIQVVMMAVPNPTLILSPADFYETVASELEVLIDVDTIADVLQYPGNKSDAVHPNAKGYRVMGEAIYELLKSNGAF